MRTIVLLSCVFLLAHSGLVTQGSGCPEQYVPDTTNICIRPNYIQGCETYKTVDTCDTCSQDYEKVNGLCYSVTAVDLASSIIIGCLASNGNFCLNCANGFIKTNGACQKGVKFCAAYDADGSCSQCENEYSLIFGDCKHNLMLGCRQEQIDHTCTDCFDPFQLQNYQCSIPNCKSYNDFGCISCECGYFITETRSCQLMQNGCLKYYRGTCVECITSYKLKGGVCVIEGCLTFDEDQEYCKTCDDSYDWVDGGCKFKNCIQWKDNACLICEEGYNLDGAKCVKSVGKYICEG